MMPVMQRSPFPGMDPYLEARWDDVHATLISYFREALQEVLPDELAARIEQRLVIQEEDEEERSVRPDVYVAELQEVERNSGGVAVAESPATAVKPVAGVAYFEPEKQRWIEIIDRSSGNRIVTAIEILSPWNKLSGRLNLDYRRKVDQFTRGGVGMVEVDLIRGSRHRLPLQILDLPSAAFESYCAVVCAPWEYPKFRLYPISLRKPLPPIPVPLRPKDGEIWIELQPLVERTYAVGRHGDIDYAKPPVPELSREDEAWADELLRAAGR